MAIGALELRTTDAQLLHGERLRWVAAHVACCSRVRVAKTMHVSF